MFLTLPFTQDMKVESVPAAVLVSPLGGEMRFFGVTDVIDRETPVLTVPAHCARCGCLAPAAARACIASDCPSRVAA